MLKTIISDTSILIIFQKINEFDLLKMVYGELVTTPEVALEFGDILPDFIKIQAVRDLKYLEILKSQVDLGEASTIALAKEFDDVLLLIDDKKGRKLAKNLNIKISGTLGIFHKAKQMGKVDKVKPLLDKLIETDFRIGKNLIVEFLRINNEN